MITFGKRHCLNCLREFDMGHQSQRYCTPLCRAHYNNPSRAQRRRNATLDEFFEQVEREHKERAASQPAAQPEPEPEPKPDLGKILGLDTGDQGHNRK